MVFVRGLPARYVAMMEAIEEKKIFLDDEFCYRNVQSYRRVDDTIYRLEQLDLITLHRDGSITITERGQQKLAQVRQA
jgi:hypothetical protein